MKRLFLMFTILYLGCAPFNSQLLKNRVPLVSQGIHQIDGDYSNIDRDSNNMSLWTILGFDYPNPKKQQGLKMFKVNIKSVSPNLIHCSLINSEGFIISKKQIKGKLKKDYFYFKKLIIYPFIPIAFGYTDNRWRLCLKDNCLYVEYYLDEWGFYSVYGRDDTFNYSGKYFRSN